MVVLVIVGYSLLVVYEFVPLYKQKLWKDFYVNTVLGVFSFLIALLLSLGVKIPSPAMAIQGLIISMFGK